MNGQTIGEMTVRTERKTAREDVRTDDSMDRRLTGEMHAARTDVWPTGSTDRRPYGQPAVLDRCPVRRTYGLTLERTDARMVCRQNGQTYGLPVEWIDDSTDV